MASEASETVASTYPRGFSRDTEWKWPMVPARKLVTLNYGRALKADTRSPGKVPVFGTNGQCGWHDAALAIAPGLILGRKGQGPLGVEWCDKDFWVIDTAYYASTLTPDVNLKYLYHLVKYVGLNHLKDGTSNPTLSRDTFGAQLFPLPPLAEQKAIAGVLGALDDKIELNRRMNATLEALARALFQSWFVDFDPVRAKLDGRQPVGMDAATAELFPEHLDHKAEGVVPTSWNLKRWGDIATLEYGKSIRDYRESSGKYRVFGTNGPIGFHDEALCNSDGIVIGRKGAYRGVHYSPEPFFVIDTAFYLKPKAPLDVKWAYYELLRFDINSMDSGSAIPSTSRDDFYGIQVIVPPTEIQAAFGNIVGGWFARIFANDRESRTLATLRDTLLPKLLSGELRVGDAAQQLEKAMSSALSRSDFG